MQIQNGNESRKTLYPNTLFIAFLMANFPRRQFYTILMFDFPNAIDIQIIICCSKHFKHITISCCKIGALSSICGLFYLKLFSKFRNFEKFEKFENRYQKKFFEKFQNSFQKFRPFLNSKKLKKNEIFLSHDPIFIFHSISFDKF